MARFRTRMEIAGTGAAADIHITVSGVRRQEVRSAPAAGNATIHYSVESEETRLNDVVQTVDASDRPLVEQTVSRGGIVVAQRFRDPDISEDLLTRLAVLFDDAPGPPEPVEQGDSWQVEIDNPILPGATIPLTSRLEAADKVGDTNAVRVSVQAVVPAAAGSQRFIRARGSYHVDPRTGKRLDARLVLDDVPLPGVEATAHIEMIETRLPPPAGHLPTVPPAGRG